MAIELDPKIELKTNLDALGGPVLVGSVVSIFMFIYLYNDVPAVLIYSWCGLTLLGGFVRLYIRHAYLKSSEEKDPKTWLNYYSYATYFVASVWASISLITFDGLAIEKEFIVTTIMLGLASGGAMSHIANKRIAVYYSSSIIFCHVVKVIHIGQSDWHLLVCAEVLFILLIFSMLKKFNDLYKESVRLTTELQSKIDVEKELQKEKEKAFTNARLASLGEMAAGIAHEINNPLAIILGKIQVIRKSIEKTQKPMSFYEKQLEGINASCLRVADIVQSMRNLSRLKSEEEFQNFNLEDLMGIVNPLVESKIKQNNINLIIQHQNEIFKADKGEISQVIINLINNSVDAISNINEKWIKIESKKCIGGLELRVTDSGRFADIQNSDKLFDPFFTNKELGEGTGLGLSLSKSILERNHGSIEIDQTSKNVSFILFLLEGETAQ